VIEAYSITGASTDTGTTAFAQGFINPTYLLLLIKGDGTIGAN